MTPKQVESLREGLRRNVYMGGDRDKAQATADALLTLLRRDWALRVLTAWAKLFLGSWGFAADDSCHLQSEDHGWREFNAATTDDTYLAAARAAFAQLPPDVTAHLGVEP